MTTAIEEWKPSDGLTLEPSALSVISDLKNSLVVAGPGAGKTELLAQKAAFLLETNKCINPKKILAISFKKDAAVNLKERVKIRVSNNLETRFTSLTFDSFAKSILDRFMHALPEEYRPVENYEVATNDNELVKAFKKHGIYLNGKIMKKKYATKLTDKKIPNQDELYDKVLKNLLKGDEDVKASLSFSMITLLAIYILETNPMILKALRKTYSHIFLDEFQDTTNLQYELVKTCFLGTNASITAVGDNRQRIMLWAGAKEDIFECYKNDFNSNEYTLLMNHRSAPRLLEIQKIVNDHLQDEPFRPKASSKWSIEDGTAEILYFSDSNFETKYIAEKINKLINNRQISNRDIGIIVKQRVDKYSNNIIKVLEQEGIQARNEAIYQELLKEDIILLLINTLRSSLNIRDSDSWAFVWDSKLYLEGRMGTSNQFYINKLRKQIKEFLKNIKVKLDLIKDEEDLNTLLSEIIDFYDINKIKRFYPQYSQGQYVNKLREDLKTYLFMYFMKSEDWILAIDSFEGNDTIPIMTIHKSKGLEFEVVFFVGFDDNEFWTFSTQQDEDTCTFFVGLSRAKRYLYFTFSQKRFGEYCEKNEISVLYNMLKESGVVEEKYFDHKGMNVGNN